jgi:hypothetical protein
MDQRWAKKKILKADHKKQRPILGWLEDVLNDFRQIKVKRHRQKGNNREKCASVIKRAKFLKYRRAKE